MQMQKKARTVKRKERKNCLKANKTIVSLNHHRQKNTQHQSKTSVLNVFKPKTSITIRHQSTRAMESKIILRHCEKIVGVKPFMMNPLTYSTPILLGKKWKRFINKFKLANNFSVKICKLGTVLCSLIKIWKPYINHLITIS